MNSLRQLVAVQLAIAYSVIAVAGYGLHGLIPCNDPGCSPQASCCDHCGPAHQPVTDVDGPGIDGPQDTPHDGQSCPFCTLLSKVKVGHAAVVVSTLVVDSGGAQSLAPMPVVVTERINTHQPRGPPVWQA